MANLIPTRPGVPSCIAFSFPAALDSHSSLGPSFRPFPTRLLSRVPTLPRSLSTAFGFEMGRENHHWAPRRMFWVTTVGTLTTSLLSAGGADVARCTRCASLFHCGLRPWPLSCATSCKPFSCFAERLKNVNVLECIAATGSKANEARVALGMHNATKFHAVECVKGLFVPTLSLHHVLATAYPDNRRTNAAVLACYSTCYYGWIVLAMTAHYSTLVSKSAVASLAAVLFLLCGVMLGTLRGGFRARYNLRSNIVADYVSSCWLWPQVVMQLREHCHNNGSGGGCHVAVVATMGPNSKQVQGESRCKEAGEASSSDVKEESFEC